MAGLSNVSAVLYNLKKNLKNKLPTTKFPFDAIIFRLVSGTDVDFHNYDKLRYMKNAAGDDCYVFKKTGREILVPRVGVESANNTFLMLQVGEGDYRYLKELKLDDASNKLILCLHDDETMKYQFAQACKEAAIRYAKPAEWYETFAVGFVIFCVMCAIMWIITQTALGAQIIEPMKNLGNQMGNLEQAVSGLSGKLGGAVIPNAPPA